jgi:hypothetical protein
LLGGWFGPPDESLSSQHRVGSIQGLVRLHKGYAAFHQFLVGGIRALGFLRKSIDLNPLGLKMPIMN